MAIRPPLSWHNSLGFHTERTLTGHADFSARDRNMALGLGYIPLVGIMTGCLRIIKATESVERPIGSLAYRIMEFIRGVFEILGVGVVLAPIDLIASAIGSIGLYLRARKAKADGRYISV